MGITRKQKIGIGVGVLLIGLGIWFGISKLNKAKGNLQAEQAELDALIAKSKTAKTSAEKASATALIEQQKAKVETAKVKAETDKMGYAQYNSAKAKEIASKLNNGENTFSDIYSIVSGIPTQNHYRQIVNTFFAINKHQTLDAFVKSKSSASEAVLYQKMLSAKPRYNRVQTTK